MEWWEELELEVEAPLDDGVLAALATQPDDLRARVQIVLHYNVLVRQSTSETEVVEREAALMPHLLWLVEHRPEIVFRTVHVWEGGPHARSLIDAWLAAVEKRPNDFSVVHNALLTTQMLDETRAEPLALQARAVAGNNPDHVWQVGAHWMLMSRTHNLERRARAIREAIACFAQVRELDPARRFLVGIDLVKAAVAAGEHTRAEQVANELLADAHHHERTWYYGNAIHEAHLALGEIARARGDLDSASRHLVDAGRTPGSPQLNTFGPDFTLARILLEAGARDAVLAYLDGCSRFWRMDDGRLAVWRAQLQRGETPFLHRQGSLED